jgi:hypothetical protein
MTVNKRKIKRLCHECPEWYEFELVIKERDGMCKRNGGVTLPSTTCRFIEDEEEKKCTHRCGKGLYAENN